MPPEFSEKKLLATIDKVKKIDYLTVSPAHFGCLTEDLAKKFPDEAKKFYDYWKKLLLSKWNENPTTEGMINSMKIELQKVFSDASEQELEAFSNMFGDWYTKGLKSAKMI
ncbi:MAG: hypothetical protein ACFFDN_27090, partial [Candidatus Hodarchaeota archaeon]